MGQFPPVDLHYIALNGIESSCSHRMYPVRAGTVSWRGDQTSQARRHTLRKFHVAMKNGNLQRVFPLNIVISHIYVNIYQRVKPHQIPLNHHFPMFFLWFSMVIFPQKKLLGWGTQLIGPRHVGKGPAEIGHMQGSGIWLRSEFPLEKKWASCFFCM